MEREVRNHEKLNLILNKRKGIKHSGKETKVKERIRKERKRKGNQGKEM